MNSDDDKDLEYKPPEKKSMPFEKSPQIFPEIPARYSYQEFNLDLIETIAEVKCRFEVPGNRSCELVAFIINSVAGQNPQVPSENEGQVDESAVEEKGESSVEEKRSKKEVQKQYVFQKNHEEIYC